eukprot:640665-Prymnesium_polylepis.1
MDPTAVVRVAAACRVHRSSSMRQSLKQSIRQVHNQANVPRPQVVEHAAHVDLVEVAAKVLVLHPEGAVVGLGREGEHLAQPASRVHVVAGMVWTGGGD